MRFLEHFSKKSKAGLRVPIQSPVLVVDGLGISAKICAASASELVYLVDQLDDQFAKAIRDIPGSVIVRMGDKEYCSKDFSSLRFNDMFILFSEEEGEHYPLRYAVTAAVAYLQLIVLGSIPRGGLGYGLVYRREDIIIGKGFLDAYVACEKRGAEFKNICAIQVSQEFEKQLPSTKPARRLLCTYRDRVFLNPRALIDPDLGEFDNSRILDLLEKAGTNQEKLVATEEFLKLLKSYDLRKEQAVEL